MPAGGPYELRPAFPGEDVSVVVTVPAVVTGWAVAAAVESEGGVPVPGSAVTCAVTNGTGGVVTAGINGDQLAVGLYYWAVRRTDAGSRSVLAWGTLLVRDPQPG